MAVAFTAETDRYEVATGAMPGGAAAWTVTYWTKLAGEWSGTRPVWAASGVGGDYLGAGVDADPEAYAGAFSPDGVLVANSDPIDYGRWHRLAVVGAADGTVTLHWGIGATGTLHAAMSAPTAVALVDVDTLYLGGSHIPGAWLDGSVANVKHYAAALTTGEIEAELASWSAVRTADLVRHHRLQTPELVDYSGNGHTLTAGTTAPVLDEDDPPISSSVAGELAGALPVLAVPGGALAGTVGSDGAVAGSLVVLPALDGQLAGTVGTDGAVAGSLVVLPVLGGRLTTASPAPGPWRGGPPTRRGRWTGGALTLGASGAG